MNRSLLLLAALLFATPALAACPDVPGPFTQGNVCPYSDASKCFTAANANSIVQAIIDVCEQTEANAATISQVRSVQPITCSGTDKLSAIRTDGTPVCSKDQSGPSALPSGLTQYAAQTIPVDPTIANGTTYGYLLLAKAYVSGTQVDSEVNGIITMSRGGTASAGRSDMITVSSKSAYNTEHLIYSNTYNGSSFVMGPVKVTCSGMVYHAIKLTNAGGPVDMGATFSGVAYNSALITTGAVPASACTGETAYGKTGLLVDATTGAAALSSNLNISGAVNINNGAAVSGGPFWVLNQALQVQGGDMWTWRAGGGSGVVYLGSSGTQYIFFDGASGHYYTGNQGYPIGIGYPTTNTDAARVDWVNNSMSAWTGSALVNASGLVLYGGGRVTASKQSTGNWTVKVPANTSISLTPVDPAGNAWQYILEIASYSPATGTYTVRAKNGSGGLIDIAFAVTYAPVW